MTDNQTTRKPRRTWDNYRELYEIQKSERLKLVIGAGARDGFKCIQIREFYLNKTTQEWRPGRDGLIIPLAAPLKGVTDENGKPVIVKPILDLLSKLPEAVKFAATMALADPEHEVWFPPKEQN